MRPVVLGLLLIGMFVVSSCSAVENFSSRFRSVSVDSIVLHAIAGPYCDGGAVEYSSAKSDLLFWTQFFRQHKVVGIHYIIGRNGMVVKSVDENRVANHAIGWNERSIGIELINKGDGKESYPSIQIESLIVLVRKLRIKYPSIMRENIVRHSDIDKRVFKCGSRLIKQKQDPGLKFDYKSFLEEI